MYLDLIETVKNLEDSFDVLGADMNGKDAFEFAFQKRSALVMGSESHGLSEELKNLISPITIPQFGKSESLNVGMAAGILMAQYKRTIS